MMGGNVQVDDCGDEEDSDILDAGNLSLGEDSGEEVAREWFGLNRCCNLISVAVVNYMEGATICLPHST